jgi:hypothetical protein
VPRINELATVGVRHVAWRYVVQMPVEEQGRSITRSIEPAEHVSLVVDLDTVVTEIAQAPG